MKMKNIKKYPATIIELENGDFLATPVSYDKISENLRKKKKAAFVELYAAYFHPESTTTINLKLSELHKKTINARKIMTVEESKLNYVTIVDDMEDDD